MKGWRKRKDYCRLSSMEDESGEALTSYGGLPLVVETCEALGLARLVKQHVRIKQRQRGYSESQYVRV